MWTWKRADKFGINASYNMCWLQYKFSGPVFLKILFSSKIKNLSLTVRFFFYLNTVVANNDLDLLLKMQEGAFGESGLILLLGRPLILVYQMT